MRPTRRETLFAGSAVYNPCLYIRGSHVFKISKYLLTSPFGHSKLCDCINNRDELRGLYISSNKNEFPKYNYYHVIQEE